MHEVGRRTWPRADARTLAEVESFLADAGLPVTDLTSGRGAGGTLAGAGVLLGADVGAWALGLPAGPATPAPGVPDACVVLYADEAATPDGRPRAQLGPFVPSWSEQEHAAAVRSVRDLVAAGEVYQVNVVGAWSATVERPGRLALPMPARWAGGMAGDGWQVVTASPELMVGVRGGVATTEPVKGTSRDPGALRTSTKDRAEHVMIVDLERNDLGRVAVTGGVRVEELYAVRPWTDLWHAHSRVTARLREGTGLAALLGTVLPGGSVTGAPKHAAVRALQSLESVGRGPSMGALGWVDGRTGAVDLGLTIRTAALDESTRRCVVWAGGGVTWSSVPENEVAEAWDKARPVVEALSRTDD